MKKLTDKVSALLSGDYQREHSEFQIEHFIVGAQGHPWMQYKQALRELDARHHGIESGAAEIVALKREADRLKRRAWNPIGRKKRRDKRAQIERKLKAERASFRSRMREYVAFYRLAVVLKRRVGELTPEKRRMLEAESWADKARRLAALDVLTTGAVTRQTAEFISHFPREMRRGLFTEIAEPQQLMRLLE